ncbi:MAG: hypothetical protein ABIG96_02000 [Candidatus Micrarchaeota archaeon]
MADADRGLYGKLEDSYYGFCDFLQQKAGIPIYDFFITPIETKGMPSFPIFVLLLLLISLGGYFAFLNFAPSSTDLKVTVMKEGIPLSGVPVLLELDGDEFKTLESDASGTVTFQGVPTGKEGKITIRKEGFVAFEKTFKIGRQNPEITASLQAESAESRKERVTVKITDSNGIPLSGATVSYLDSETDAYDQKISDATGLVTIFAASRNSQLAITVEKTNYQKATSSVVVSGEKSKTIALQKKGITADPTDPEKTPKGEVFVTVTDEEGNYVDATVELRLLSTDEALEKSRTGDSGKVRWADVNAVGAKVYVVVMPRDPALFLTYDGTDDAAALTSNDPLEFMVQLVKKELARDYNITIIVTDKAGAAIQGAAIRWYNQETNAALSSNPALTDSLGKAVFSSDKTVYVTVYKDTYLPNMELDLQAGDSKTIELEKITDDNNAAIKVTVVDSDSNFAEGAKVSLYTEDGFFMGIPSQTTLEDGTVTFAKVPLELRGAEAKYFVKASKGSVSGTSSTFFPELGVEKEVAVKLAQATGTAIVKLKDATTQKALQSGRIMAYLREDETQKIAECTLSAGSCSMQLPANKPIFFKITSTGYIDLESEDIFVDADEQKTFEAGLIPAGLQNELVVIYGGISPVEGTEAYSADFPSLSKGSFYKAKFTLNLPAGNSKGGIFLKIAGSDGVNADDDFVAISSYQKPENSVITKGFTYKPSVNCRNDIISPEDASNKLVKWLNYEYSGQQGSKVVTVTFFVKPKAKSGDFVGIDFRGYASAGKVFTRTPEDASFGNEGISDSADSCYAKTNHTRIAIADDRFTCTDKACISLTFSEDGVRKVSRGFAVESGKEFNSYFSVRALKDFSNSPYIKIWDDKELKFYSYAFGSETGTADGKGEATFTFDSLDAGKSASGMISMKGLIPTSFSKVYLEFGDGDGPIYQYKTSVQITGTNGMDLTVIPREILANEDKKLTSTLTNSLDGSAITDAEVSIEEDDSSTFDGYSPETIIGDGTEETGKGGKYTFKRVHPYSTGGFMVIAKRPGFKDAEEYVNVTLNDFLESSPKSLVLSCDGATLDLSNLLNARITVSTASQCLQVQGDGVTTAGASNYNFDLTAKKAKSLIINPIKQGTACDLDFSANAPSGTAAHLKVPVRINCANLAKFCTTDAQCGDNFYCDESSAECKKVITQVNFEPLPTSEITITLDEDLVASASYSLAALTADSRVTECTIKSSDSDEASQMQNYINVDCSSSENVLSLDADYNGHAYYQPPALDNYQSGLITTSNKESEISFSSEKPVSRISFASTASDYCGKANVAEVQSCTNGGFAVVSSALGGGITYYNSDGTARASCPVVSPESESSVCRELSSLSCAAIACNNADAGTVSSSEIVQTGRLYVKFSNKPQLSIRIIVKGPKSPYAGEEGTQIVYITKLGFEPAEVHIPENGKVIWINMDDRGRKVESQAGSGNFVTSSRLFSSPLIPAKGKYEYKFTKTGVYNTRDTTRTAIKGVVYVGDLDMTCRYKNANYFAQKFIGHLARSLTSFFDPSGGKSQQIAYSSVYKFFVTPNGITADIAPGLANRNAYPGVNGLAQPWSPTQASRDYYSQMSGAFPTSTISEAQDQGICEKSGTGFKCKVYVTPLLPSNGMAFTIVNDYAIYSAAPEKLLIKGTRGSDDIKYLYGVYVDEAGVDGFIRGKLSDLKSLFIESPRYATFLLLNKPSMMEYYWDGSQIGIKFQGKPAGESLTQKLDVVFPSRQQAFSIEIEFEIKNDIGKYALLTVPAGNKVYSRTGSDSAPEPFYFINNIPASDLNLSIPATSSMVSGSISSSRLYYTQQVLSATSPNSLGLSLIRKKVVPSKIAIALPSAVATDSKLNYDLIGNIGADPETNGVFTCSANNFCTVGQYGTTETAIQAELDEMQKDIVVQRLDFAGFGDYAARRFAEAFALTIRDYFADKIQYELCKGVDALREGVCSQTAAPDPTDYNCYGGGAYCDNSVSWGELGSITKEEFGQAACDSELLNNFNSLVGSQNWDALKAVIMNKLMSNSNFMPRIQYTKPIVGTDKLQISVLFKRAADSGKTSGYAWKSFKVFQQNADTGLGEEGYIPFTDILGEDDIETKAPTETLAVPATGPVSSGTLLGVGFEPVSQMDKDKKEPRYFYIDNSSTNPVLRLDQPGTPNLLTMNKYPLDLTNDKLTLFKSAFDADLSKYVLESKTDARKITVTSCVMTFKDASEGESLELVKDSKPDSCFGKFNIAEYNVLIGIEKLEQPFSIISLKGSSLEVMVAGISKPNVNGDEKLAENAKAQSNYIGEAKAAVAAALKYLFNEQDMTSLKDYELIFRGNYLIITHNPEKQTPVQPLEPPGELDKLQLTPPPQITPPAADPETVKKIVPWISVNKGECKFPDPRLTAESGGRRFIVEKGSKLCVFIVIDTEMLGAVGGNVQLYGGDTEDALELGEAKPVKTFYGKQVIEIPFTLDEKMTLFPVYAKFNVVIPNGAPTSYGRYWFNSDKVQIKVK